MNVMKVAFITADTEDTKVAQSSSSLCAITVLSVSAVVN
ncbi:MAG: hypothetical protein QOE46_444 [Acidobacteriota bacterium]|jgi:hypothetical protein|nr:hypothetical protein [Acidobacteriota bacterium]